MEISALVPAAGSGRRIRQKLGSRSLPKPFLKIGGTPILARTLFSLQSVPEVREIVVACDPAYRSAAKRIVSDYRLSKVKKIVPGGETRADSVRKALSASNSAIPYAMVHDAARPFLSSGAIRKFLNSSKKGKASGWVLGRPAIPTLKEVSSGAVSRTLDRSVIWEIETPQLFKKNTLKDAYRKIGKFKATDDSSIVEQAGGKVRVILSDSFNPKITTLEDLKLADKLLSAGEVRSGLGEDRHRLVSGRPLILGGVRVPSPKGAEGHSDGDVIFHSIVDAILGALGAGDIGDYFPPGDKRYKNAASKTFVARAVSLMKGKGFKLNNVDVTLTLESPKLGPLKKKIQENVAKLLGVTINQVGIKAKTAEGLGPEGEGLAVAARALASLRGLS